MIRKSGCRFSEKIMLKMEMERDDSSKKCHPAPAVKHLAVPDRRLWTDRRLRDCRADRPGRIDRLAVLAGLRFRRLLCRTSRQREARPLADRAGRRGYRHL